jgi:hypothetical protein
MNLRGVKKKILSGVLSTLILLLNLVCKFCTDLLNFQNQNQISKLELRGISPLSHLRGAYPPSPSGGNPGDVIMIM